MHQSYTDRSSSAQAFSVKLWLATWRQLRNKSGVWLSERTIAGLKCARVQGRVDGRPKTEDSAVLMKTLRSPRKEGKSNRAIAAELELATGTVQKLVKEQAA